MSEEYSRIKHLDYITMDIERMARNSFMCKAWAVTLTVALLAFNAKCNINKYAPAVAMVAIFSLWWLDAFYLRLERLFRKLYEDVRNNDYTHDQYTMNTSLYKNTVPSEIKIMITKSELPFYIPLLLTNIFAAQSLIQYLLTVLHCSK